MGTLALWSGAMALRFRLTSCRCHGDSADGWHATKRCVADASPLFVSCVERNLLPRIQNPVNIPSLDGETCCLGKYYKETRP